MLKDMCLMTRIGLAQILTHFDVYDSYWFVYEDSNSILCMLYHIMYSACVCSGSVYNV